MRRRSPVGTERTERCRPVLDRHDRRPAAACPRARSLRRRRRRSRRRRPSTARSPIRPRPRRRSQPHSRTTRGASARSRSPPMRGSSVAAGSFRSRSPRRSDVFETVETVSGGLDERRRHHRKRVTAWPCTSPLPAGAGRRSSSWSPRSVLGSDHRRARRSSIGAVADGSRALRAGEGTPDRVGTRVCCRCMSRRARLQTGPPSAVAPISCSVGHATSSSPSSGTHHGSTPPLARSCSTRSTRSTHRPTATRRQFAFRGGRARHAHRGHVRPAIAPMSAADPLDHEDDAEHDERDERTDADRPLRQPRRPSADRRRSRARRPSPSRRSSRPKRRTGSRWSRA